MSETLPQGWIGGKLSDFCIITMGQSPPGDTYNTEKIGLPFFQGKAEFGKIFPTTKKYCSTPKKTAAKGDVLLSVRAPVGPINISTELCCIGRGLAGIRAYLDESQSFIHFYFLSIQDWLSIQGAGSTFQAIGKDFLYSLPVPLPPLNEQKRIVAKLDKIMLRIDLVKARLDRVPTIIKRFRQSVLTAAVTGKLTEKWREEQNLLQEWRNDRLEAVIKDGPQNGLYKCQDFYGKGVLILRIDNFYNCEINPWTTLKRLQLNKNEQNIYQLSNGDIVINRVNSMPFLGKSALVRELKEPCVFESNMMRIRIDKSQITPEFLIRFLNCQFGLTELRKNAKHAVNQSIINQQDVKAVIIPIPPLEEQKEIVRQVDKLFALADKLESHYQKAKTHVDKLSQSVLAKAFRGELVPQDPNDEPAEKLLERIIAEKAKMEGGKKKAGGRKKETK